MPEFAIKLIYIIICNMKRNSRRGYSRASMRRGQHLVYRDRLAGETGERTAYAVRRRALRTEGGLLRYILAQNIFGPESTEIKSPEYRLALLSKKYARTIAMSGRHLPFELEGLTNEACQSLPSTITGKIGQIAVFGGTEHTIAPYSYVALVPDSDLSKKLKAEANFLTQQLDFPPQQQFNPHLSIAEYENAEFAYAAKDRVEALLDAPGTPTELTFGIAQPYSFRVQ